jgi:superfamily II DNA helicase RecQ
VATMLERVRELREKREQQERQERQEQQEQVQDAQVTTISKPKASKMSIDDALKAFGHTEFREGQKEAIMEAMSGSNGVMCVFPTGAGKSLVYQIPSLISENLTIVVSPLIALMKDQVDKLQSLGINAILINSSLPMQDAKLAMAEVFSGGVRALYVSPERFGNPEFNRSIEKMDVDIFAVDEAHCFIGSSMVLTPDGERRIDSLRVGDEVISSGPSCQPIVGRVSRLFIHRGLDVWKVRINGRDTYCDGGQEFFVKNTGFVRVDRLQCGHEIIIESAESRLSGVRDSQDDANSQGQTAKQVLLDEVPKIGVGEDKNSCDGGQGVSGLREIVSDEAGIQDRVLFDAVWPAFGEEEGRGFGADGSGQSDKRPGSSRCYVEKSEGNRQVQGESRRKWEGFDSGGERACPCGESHDKSHCSDGALSGWEWLSDALQAGLVVSIGESHSGSGRPVSQGIENTRSRPAEGIVFNVARVESVSRVERGCTLPTGECLGGNPVGVRFYDIEVEGTHNFFVSGALVHNCISRWGNDFRPAYAELGGVIERINPRQVVALTATATEKVREDICRSLHIEGAKRFIQSVYRPNLQFAIVEATGHERDEYIRVVSEGANTGIVYAATRKDAESITEYLCTHGVKATCYHAGLHPKKRTEIQNEWSEDGGIIIATSAFGMGIDRPDVRFVIHNGLSPSIEDFYQAVGRAGRDGKDALCLTLCDFSNDYRTQVFLIDTTSPSGKDVKGFWAWLKRVAAIEAQGNSSVEIKMIQKDMSEQSGYHNVGACISFLKQEGLVKTLGRGSYQVRLDLDDAFDVSQIDGSRQSRIDKLNQFTSLCRDNGCRYRHICDYFGDLSLDKDCGKCDNCTG